MRNWLGALLACSSICACATMPLLDERRLVDLTHDSAVGMPSPPSETAFLYERLRWGRDDLGRWSATGQFSASERSGTYLSAPLAFAEGMRATPEIPLPQLIAPIRVIDVASACARQSDYLATPIDLERHESKHGRVPAGAAVIVRTGWEGYWNNPRRYLGRADAGKPEELHFPGLSYELANELVRRKVDLVGIDGPSIDHGISTEFLAQRELARANVPALANLAGVSKLPAYGATLIALPIRMAGASGGPVRVVALVP